MKRSGSKLWSGAKSVAKDPRIWGAAMIGVGLLAMTGIGAAIVVGAGLGLALLGAAKKGCDVYQAMRAGEHGRLASGAAATVSVLGSLVGTALVLVGGVGVLGHVSSPVLSSALNSIAHWINSPGAAPIAERSAVALASFELPTLLAATRERPSPPPPGRLQRRPALDAPDPEITQRIMRMHAERPHDLMAAIATHHPHVRTWIHKTPGALAACVEELDRELAKSGREVTDFPMTGREEEDVHRYRLHLKSACDAVGRRIGVALNDQDARRRIEAAARRTADGQVVESPAAPMKVQVSGYLDWHRRLQAVSLGNRIMVGLRQARLAEHEDADDDERRAIYAEARAWKSLIQHRDVGAGLAAQMKDTLMGEVGADFAGRDADARAQLMDEVAGQVVRRTVELAKSGEMQLTGEQQQALAEQTIHFRWLLSPRDQRHLDPRDITLGREVGKGDTNTVSSCEVSQPDALPPALAHRPLAFKTEETASDFFGMPDDGEKAAKKVLHDRLGVNWEDRRFTERNQAAAKIGALLGLEVVPLAVPVGTQAGRQDKVRQERNRMSEANGGGRAANARFGLIMPDLNFDEQGRRQQLYSLRQAFMPPVSNMMEAADRLNELLENDDEDRENSKFKQAVKEVEEECNVRVVFKDNRDDPYELKQPPFMAIDAAKLYCDPDFRRHLNQAALFYRCSRTEDAHPGNVLVSFDAEGRYTGLYCIDHDFSGGREGDYSRVRSRWQVRNDRVANGVRFHSHPDQLQVLTNEERESVLALAADELRLALGTDLPAAEVDAYVERLEHEQERIRQLPPEAILQDNESYASERVLEAMCPIELNDLGESDAWFHHPLAGVIKSTTGLVDVYDTAHMEDRRGLWAADPRTRRVSSLYLSQ